jgi:anti-sigma regulatory factor (Ser/Thr protein kinase)/biotin operon repressor
MSGTTDRILKLVARPGGLSGGELCRRMGLSRQALHKHLRPMILRGVLVKTGVTKAAVYHLPGRADGGARTAIFRKRYRLKALSEDRAFDEAALRLGLAARTPKNVMELARYAFTEMLNNAIDHARSPWATVEMAVNSYDIRFTVRDAGIGVFRSIVSRFGLRDEPAAAAELLKGKTTTMAQRHSGEGIFFTSKAADEFILRSHRLELTVNHRRGDTFLSQKRFLRGTDVQVRIGRRTRRLLRDLFHEYAPGEYDYRFERTRVRVSLFQSEYVSRSEAKRLLVGLDRFREVVLDFRGVKSLGQAFADEVFRVFRKIHPQVSIRTQHAIPAVDAMIRHVVDNVDVAGVDNRLT